MVTAFPTANVRIRNIRSGSERRGRAALVQDEDRAEGDRGSEHAEGDRVGPAVPGRERERVHEEHHRARRRGSAGEVEVTEAVSSDALAQDARHRKQQQRCDRER